MSLFKAFRVDQVDKKHVGGFCQMREEELDLGDVDIRVVYSAVNYKDALAATGQGRIIRRFPCVAGVDLAGYVIESRDARFKPGDQVLATSYDIGVAHHGGYAERARLPSKWVHTIPEGLSLFEAMALGTAGVTAALAVSCMERNGLTPEGEHEVAVTGATGGVGSLAVDMLSALGYNVTAITGKSSEQDYLHMLGAKQVLLRQEINLEKIRPLDSSRWAAAVDNLGGDMLSWLLSNTRPGGVVASIGLAAGMQLNTTVAPFILRGVSLLGIDSVSFSNPPRSMIWQRLASDLKPRQLDSLAQCIAFDDLPDICEKLIAGQAKGRYVVRISEE